MIYLLLTPADINMGEIMAELEINFERKLSGKLDLGDLKELSSQVAEFEPTFVELVMALFNKLKEELKQLDYEEFVFYFNNDRKTNCHEQSIFRIKVDKSDISIKLDDEKIKFDKDKISIYDESYIHFVHMYEAIFDYVRTKVYADIRMIETLKYRYL